MPTIPFEDNFADVIAKAQTGLNIGDEDLMTRAGLSPEEMAGIKAAQFDEAAVRKAAGVLNLGADALVELGKQSWVPEEHSIEGFLQFTSPYNESTVNSYLIFDVLTRHGIIFDTGTDSREMLAFIQKRLLRVRLIFITHAHADHIADLRKVRIAVSSLSPAYSCALEPVELTEGVPIGKKFVLGNFEVTVKQTAGHAVGGVTYYVTGLKKPVAFCGDALFCSSIGRPNISYGEQLKHIRENIFTLPDNTVLCPGHGPMTTIAEQKRHNPFFPELRG